MVMTNTVTATDSPVFFHAGGESLFGVITHPGAGYRNLGFVIANSAGYYLASGRNRVWQRLGHRLSDRGFPAIRFTYRGTGDSTGAVDQFSLRGSFSQDVAGAVDFLTQQGIESVAVVGSCFGSRCALDVAAEHPNVRAAVLLSPPLRDSVLGQEKSMRVAQNVNTLGYVQRGLRLRTLRAIFEPKRRQAYQRIVAAKLSMIRRRSPRHGRVEHPSWMSSKFLDNLSAAVSRGVLVHLVFGADESSYADFVAAKEGRLGKILADAGSLVTTSILDGPVHSLWDIGVQDRVVAEVEKWAADSWPEVRRIMAEGAFPGAATTGATTTSPLEDPSNAALSRVAEQR
ncbi:MAG: alpha/beta fold hydrolase [Dehalococcoidia bacterium]